MIQEQVISKILDTKDSSLITLNQLDESFFSNYKAEWVYITNHFKTYGNVPDKETFLSVFPDFDLVNVTESSQYLIDELYKEHQNNQLATTFNAVRKLLLDGKTDEAVQVYRQAYDNLVTNIPLATIDILKDTSRYDDYVKRIDNYDQYFIHTGFPELDNIIGGWDREEELATIIARPNVGKSWILMKCALAAAQQGLRVGIYSGEMSEKKVGYRIDSLFSHISNGALTHGNALVQNDYKNYIDHIDSVIDGSIRVLTPKMLNSLASVTSLRAFIEKDNLDILFIDQHSLLLDDRKAKNPVERASNISTDLKQLQVLKRIPIISVSQMNRTKNEGDSDAIDLAQIAQADKIGQDSTIVIGLSKDKDPEKSLLKMHLVKSRDSGEVGKILTYKADFNTGVFNFIPGENDTAVSQDNSRYGEDEVFD